MAEALLFTLRTEGPVRSCECTKQFKHKRWNRMFARLIFAAVNFAARNGLTESRHESKLHH